MVPQTTIGTAPKGHKLYKYKTSGLPANYQWSSTLQNHYFG